jgi:hypothetical protein
MDGWMDGWINEFETFLLSNIDTDIDNAFVINSQYMTVKL